MIEVLTATGSVYLIDNEALLVKRASVGEHSFDLRRDGDVLRLFKAVEPEVGAPMTMMLEPLAEAADVTVRTTSEVAAFREL